MFLDPEPNMRHGLRTQLTLLALLGSIADQAPGQEPRPRSDRSGADLARELLKLPPNLFEQSRIAGFPTDSKPEVLTWQRVYHLALIRTWAAVPPRFETLDPEQLANQAAALGLNDFTRFRAGFVSSRDFRDPGPDFLDLQARLLQIEATLWDVAHQERWTEVLKEMINGEASGLGLLDLDQSRSSVVAARRRFSRSIAEYRDRLDLLKVTLGLAPRSAVTIDLAPVTPFREVFEAMDRWSLTAGRELTDLDEIVGRLPRIGDITIANRPILAEIEDDPGRLEQGLALATRFALGNRHERDEPADAVELRVRRRLRHLLEIRTDYSAEARSLVLAFRLLDRAFEQIIAPPAGVTPLRSGQATTGLVGYARQIAEHRGRLVILWTSFQAEKLACDRDLGLVIDADWPAFLARFAARAGRVEVPLLAEPPPGPVVPLDPVAVPAPPPPPSSSQ